MPLPKAPLGAHARHIQRVSFTIQITQPFRDLGTPAALSSFAHVENVGNIDASFVVSHSTLWDFHQRGTPALPPEAVA